VLVRAQAGITLAGLYIHDTTDYDYTVKLDGVRGAVVRNCITRGKPGQWNWLIYNCTDAKIVNNVFDGGYVQLLSWNGGSSGPGSTGTMLFNNVFRGAGYSAIMNWDDLTDLAHGYNCFWNNARNYFQTTVVGPGEITADPRFPGGSPPDYHLVPGSPAIDAGTDVGIGYVGTRPDIGAIEADYAAVTGLSDVWGSEPGAWVYVTDPKAVTASSTTFVDGSYYVEERSRTRGIKIVPHVSGLPSVGPGSWIAFFGEVRIDSKGEKYVDVYDIAPSAGAALAPVGVNNRLLAEGLEMTGLLVRTWGLVTQVTSDYIYADDGSGLDDGSGNGPGIRIVLSGLTSPITRTFVKGATYLRGVTGLVGRDTGGVICLRPRSDADIQL
ncbi:MAG: hypothetical protein ACP5R5_14710, partial [Armatimonadota bacterium]